MRVWLPFATSAGLVVILALFVDWSSLPRLLSSERWLPLALGVGAYATSLGLRGLRFCLLLGRLAPRPVGWRSGTDLAAISTFANHTLPFRLGELLFVFLSWSAHQVPAERAALTLLTVRLYDLLCALLVFCTGAMGLGLASEGWGAVGWGAAILLLFALALRVDLLLGGSSWLISGALRAGQPGASPRRQRLAARLEGFRQGIDSLRGRALIGRIFALSLAVWIALPLSFHQLLAAFGMGLSLPQVAVGSLGASLVSVLPVSALGNIGLLEAGWAAGFVALGVARSDAVASGFAMHAIAIGVSGVLALVAFGRQGSRTWQEFTKWRRRERAA